MPPPAGATYPGSPDLFRAAARTTGDTFLATGVSKIRLQTKACGAGAAKTSQSPRRGRDNSDLADEHFGSNVVINNLDHIFAEFCAGLTSFNNPSVLIAAANRF